MGQPVRDIPTFDVTMQALDLFDQGFVCVSLPRRAIGFLLGALEPLRHPDIWRGTTQEIALISRQWEDVIVSLIMHESCQAPAPEIPAPIQILGGAGGACGQTENEEKWPMIYINTDTDELVYVCGCQEFRYPLSGQVNYFELPVDDNGEFNDEPGAGAYVPPDDIAEDWGELIVYTACGMADHLVDRIWNIGQAAWDNRTTPITVRNAVLAANPGYTVSMEKIYYLWGACQALAVGESVGDFDLFGSKFKQAWKCWLSKQLEGDETQTTPLSESEYKQFILYGYSFAWLSESPDAWTLIDTVVPDFWRMVVNVLGIQRCNDILLEAAGLTAADCCDDVIYEDPPTVTGDLVWTGIANYSSPAGTQTIEWLNQGRTIKVSVSNITASQYAGLQDGTEFYLQVINGGTVTEFEIAFEMIQGNMSGDWHTGSCDTIASPAWLGSNADEVRDDFLGGNSRVEFTHQGAGWTGQAFVVTNVRFCPHNDLLGDTVSFYAHIISVNGVSTGIADPFEGQTPA